MPAELESGFFGSRENGERWAAWHGLGTVIDRPVVNTEEAIVLAGLDWNIVSVPLRAVLPDGRTTDSPRHVLQVREDTGRVLGVTSPLYEPLQNRERFAFMDSLLQADEAKWHTAGSLREDRQVWMLAELPTTIKIAGLSDEQINWYLLLTDGTDGTMALTIAPTPVRVVCTNTCRMAVAGAPRVWRARHVGTMDGRMQEARDTLKLTYAYIEGFQAEAERLIEAKLAPSEFRAFLQRLLPMPDDAEPTDRTYQNVLRRRGAIAVIHKTSPNLQNVQGTKWAALQAVGEWNDWERGRKVAIDATPEKRRAAQESAWLRRMATAADDPRDRAAALLEAL